MRYQMDNYEQPTRRQMRPSETEDVAVKVRLKVYVLGESLQGCKLDKDKIKCNTWTHVYPFINELFGFLAALEELAVV